MNKLILNFFLLLVFNGLGITSNAQPAWSVNPHNYEFSMTITGKVVIEGQISSDQNDKVAVFAGNECRGVTNVRFDPGLNSWFVYLMVYSNRMGDTLRFYVYDASRNEILKVLNPVTFTVNNIIGSPDEPYLFKAASLNSALFTPETFVTAFPNPFSDRLNIRFRQQGKAIIVRIYSSDGKQVLILSGDSESPFSMDTRKLVPGIYFLEWMSGLETGKIRLVKF